MNKKFTLLAAALMTVGTLLRRVRQVMFRVKNGLSVIIIT